MATIDLVTPTADEPVPARRAARRSRWRAVALLAAMLGVALGLPGKAVADSGGVPNLVATPAINLSASGVTTVTVQITRAVPSVDVLVQLCVDVPGSTDCDAANARQFTTDAQGAVLGTVPVDYLAGATGCDEISPSFHCYLRAHYLNGPSAGQTVDTQTVRFAGHTSGTAFVPTPRFELSSTAPTVLTITGMGFAPSTTVVFNQCRNGGGFPGTCASGDAVAVDAQGVVTANLTVNYLVQGTASSPCDSGPGLCYLRSFYTGGPGVTFGQIAGSNVPISFQGHSLLNAAPTASLSASPTSGDIGLAVTASGSGSSANGGTSISSYTFDWGDGTVTGPQSSANATHTYLTYGAPHTLRLSVTNAAGVTATTTRPITINDINPTAVIDSSFVAPNRVRIDGSGSLTNGGSAIGAPGGSYRFDFGDGTPVVTQASAVAEHTYSTPGAYTVSLTVRNQSNLAGTATAQVDTATYNAAPEIRVDTSSERMATDGATTVVLLNTTRTTDQEGNLPISYVVDWGEPAPGVTTSGAGPLFSHVYEAVGNRQLRITATDSAGKVATTTRPIRIYDQKQLFGLATGTALKYATPTSPVTDTKTSFQYTVNLTDTTVSISGSGTGTTSANLPLATAKACIAEHWTVSYSPSTTKTVTPTSTDFTAFLSKPIFNMMTASTSNPATVGTGGAPRQLQEQCTTGQKSLTLGAAGVGQASLLAGVAPAPGIKIRCITHWQAFSVYSGPTLYKQTWSKKAPVVCKL